MGSLLILVSLAWFCPRGWVTGERGVGFFGGRRQRDFKVRPKVGKDGIDEPEGGSRIPFDQVGQLASFTSIVVEDRLDQSSPLLDAFALGFDFVAAALCLPNRFLLFDDVGTSLAGKNDHLASKGGTGFGHSLETHCVLPIKFSRLLTAEPIRESSEFQIDQKQGIAGGGQERHQSHAEVFDLLHSMYLNLMAHGSVPA
jgi:hypothetical protein